MEEKREPLSEMAIERKIQILRNGLSTLFQTNFFRLFFRYCTGV